MDLVPNFVIFPESKSLNVPKSNAAPSGAEI